MALSISTKGFREAVAKLHALGNAPASAGFRTMLADTMEPIRMGVIRNIHSITGRTVQDVESGIGRGASPSAYVKVGRRFAIAISRGKRISYPRVVEAGHGKVPAYPFFRNAVEANRPAVRRSINAGVRDFFQPYIQSPQIGGEFN